MTVLPFGGRELLDSVEQSNHADDRWRYALWSDGTLSIEVGENGVDLTPWRMTELFNFLAKRLEQRD